MKPRKIKGWICPEFRISAPVFSGTLAIGGFSRLKKGITWVCHNGLFSATQCPKKCKGPEKITVSMDSRD